MMTEGRSGSVFGLLYWQWKFALLFLAAGSTTWAIHHYLDYPKWLLLPTLPLAVVGGAIGIFVSFRTNQAYDRWYVPQQAFTTGDIDIHDVAVDGEGEPLFVSTLFSCLARPHPRYSLAPFWKPPFVSRYAAEDRCHLNGLAMRDGRPALVTCVGRSDANEGWREHRRDGGLLIDVASSEVVAEGLSMPHSPRWYRDRLWLLNAGTGEFGHVEIDSGRFVPVAFCPGFMRGLSFVGDYAVVGISEQREKSSMSDLLLDERLRERGVKARCAVQVIDLRRGDVAHELRIEGAVTELFDTAVLPGCRNPGAIGFQSDEIRRTLVLPPDAG